MFNHYVEKAVQTVKCIPTLKLATVRYSTHINKAEIHFHYQKVHFYIRVINTTTHHKQPPKINITLWKRTVSHSDVSFATFTDLSLTSTKLETLLKTSTVV